MNFITDVVTCASVTKNKEYWYLVQNIYTTKIYTTYFFNNFLYGQVCDNTNSKELVKRSTSIPTSPENNIDEELRPRFNSLQPGHMNTSNNKQKLFSDISGRITDTSEEEDDTSDLEESYHTVMHRSKNAARWI